MIRKAVPVSIKFTVHLLYQIYFTRKFKYWSGTAKDQLVTYVSCYKNEVVVMTSSYTIDVINFTLKMKHMLVANKYNWFCYSIHSETPVITDEKK